MNEFDLFALVKGWTTEQIAADRGRWIPDFRIILTPEGRRLVADYLSRH